MRTKNSILNIVFGLLSQVAIVLVGLWSRKAFVNILGTEILGINATLTSIISMLALTELGVGTAILCNLYKPLEEGDRTKVIALMQTYRKTYNTIAGVVLVLSMALLTFIDKIVMPEESAVMSVSMLRFVFCLFALDMAVSYLFAYKRSLIFADQKNYLVIIIRTMFVLGTGVFQIATLYITKDFISYLIVRIIFRFLENMVVAILTDRRYPYIKTKEKYPLEKNTKKNIVENTKALMLHYVGNYLVNGTDMMIINGFLGSMTAGIYSNYLLLTTMIRELLLHISNGITAGFGSLIAAKENERLYEVFHQSMFIVFVAANTICITAFCAFNDFLDLWLGAGQTLSTSVVFIIILNLYITLTSDPIGALRSAAGLFRPDKYLHIVLAVLNLIISISLVNSIGIFGVFFGTFICLCIKELSFLPYIVYKHIFQKTLWEYQKKYLLYLLFTLIVGFFTFSVTSLIVIENLLLLLLVKGLIALVLSNGLVIIVFFKTKEFKKIKEICEVLMRKCKDNIR